MKKQNLNNNWFMIYGNKELKTNVPFSMYNTLLEHGEIEEPHYRDNELKLLHLNNNDYEYHTTFEYKDFGNSNKKELVFEGIDTLSEIYLNGVKVASTNNMHRTWIFDITSLLKEENQLKVVLLSPVKFIKEQDKLDYIGGSLHAMRGFPHLRKAHCMFGWDWGPRIPDMGIWRNVSIVEHDTASITDVHFKQQLVNESVEVTVDVTATAGEYKITLTSPDGEVTTINPSELTKVANPKLWFPNGLGKQPLYTLKVELFENGALVDEWCKKVGLRELTVNREKDQWGESFAHCINGIEFFGMGADWIPQDNLLPRITEEKTREILQDCADANFNCIRVWGGGYYPEDYFFDICDELGLVVWQDFMFSCANYRVTLEFEENIRAEFADNIKRIRHHASLGLWCGNNEMEMFQVTGKYDGDDFTKADYIKMFEYIIPSVLREFDPSTYYWPASPSSGGSFFKPNDEHMGDVHYWDVWHEEKPFKDFRNYHFRYLSEFGFQSFPMLESINDFTLPKDRNVFSRVMEMHQRNDSANGRILKYISQTYLYPTSFESLIYASHILQAEAIKYGVEHYRRHRGRCMGTIYWQLNDIWPTASWASIDYYGRKKALHYFAKKFFAPITVSCEEVGETSSRVAVVAEPSPIELSARFCVKNETLEDIECDLNYSVCDNFSKEVKTFTKKVKVNKMSVTWLDKEYFNEYDFLTNYIKYELVHKGSVVANGTVLFTAPKHFEFNEPNIKFKVEGNKLLVTADTFVKSLYIFADEDISLSDNYFDINAETIELDIIKGNIAENGSNLKFMSVYDIR